MNVAADPQAVTIGAQLEAARLQLVDAAVDEPRRTADTLLASVLGCDASHLFAHPEWELTEQESAQFSALLDRRAAGEPTQYLTGVREFYGRDFEVNSSVLIPRPETELLVEAVLELAATGAEILDVCTGSGCIATTLACERSTYTLFASDISAEALVTARRNAARHGVPVTFAEQDLLDGVEDASFDVIVSNPPYVSERDRPTLSREVQCEPALALFAGDAGLDIYRRLIPAAKQALRPGGLLALELGYDSLLGVRDLLIQWDAVEFRPDLAGIPRIALARRPSFASR